MNTNKIVAAYTELKSLGDKFICSIAQVNWWLLKYGDLYKNVLVNHNKLCSTCIELGEENLPYNCLKRPDYCLKRPELQLFINFYNELDRITQLHKLENKCYVACDEYMVLCCIEEDLRDWIIKYYEIYYELSGFYYCYLDFDVFNSNRNLHITNAPDESFGISVKRDDFKSIIKFYEVYEDLYQNKKLYPEKIEERDRFFSKIHIPKDDNR